MGAPRPERRTFGTDVLLTVGGKALFVGLGALTTVVIARALGPSGQGVFAVAFNLTLMLVQLGSAGLQVANPFFSARDDAPHGAIVTNSLLVAIAGSAVLGAGVAVLKLVAPGALAGLGWTELAITLAAIPAALATLFLQGVLLGIGRMVAYNAAEVMQAALALAGVIVAVTLFDAGIVGVLAVLTASRYASLALVLVTLHDVLGSAAGWDRALLRRVLTHGAKVYVVGLLGFLLIRVDILLVNALVGREEAGYYSIAAVVAEGLVLIPMIVGLNLLPRIARDEGSALSAAAFRVVSFVYGLVCLVSAPGAILLVPLVFGDAYRDAVPLYLWLLPGTLSLGLLNSLTVHYFVRGYPRSLMLAWVLGLIVNVAINCVLLGAYGAVVASLASSLVYTAILVAHVRVFAGESDGYGALVPRPREALQTVRGALSARA